jgi:DinB superfamily
MNELETLLERFRRGAEMVAATSAGMSGGEADFSPAPGKWTARQIVAHLADVEIVVADRLRRTIAEDNPMLMAINQDEWAERLGYSDRRLNDSLDLLRAIRTANFDLLRTLPESAFARTGRHSQRGPETVLDILRIYTGHTETHAKQIEHIREKYRESRPRTVQSQ